MGAGAQVKPTTLPLPELSADARVATAELYIGRVLFLRGFPAGSELRYDASGNPLGSPKTTDWTLAGMDLESVSQHGPAELELEGVRAAALWNENQHYFDRRLLKTEHIRILLAEPADPAAVSGVMDRVFATGIDLALQRSMPPEWRHYFIPATPWPKDGLDGVTVQGSSAALPAGLVSPVPRKQPQAELTDEARGNRIQGTAGLQLVVDPSGTPQRITIVHPLGFGLDAEAAHAIARWTFAPGTLNGQPAAVQMRVNQRFTLGMQPAGR